MTAETQHSRRWYAVAAVLLAFLAFAAILAWLAWTLTRSNLGLAGARPGSAIAGEIADARLRSMEQSCTGVVKTRNDVWLLARNETGRGSEQYEQFIPADAARLGEREGATGGGFMSRRSYLTTLARLQDDGQFKVVATVPDIACLAATPESETLYLFSWLSRPQETDDSRSRPELRQHMVFRSADQGLSWDWLESGFMADAFPIAMVDTPYFYSDEELWSWPSSADPSRYPKSDDPSLHPTFLFYSSDSGRSSAQIFSKQPLDLNDEELLSVVGISTQGKLQRSSSNIERYVVQVDSSRAYAWKSHALWLHEDNDTSQRIAVTTRMELTRSSAQAPWQVASVEHLPHLALDQLKTSADGQTHAVLYDKDGKWLARLDPANGNWVDLQSLPRLLPGWLVDDGMFARYFWSNGDYQVISLWGSINLPRILFPFTQEPASITTDAHFYTKDGGRNWHQLAIPGYLGVMGLSLHDSELFWTRGDWYNNDEPYVWRYDLAQ